MQVIRSFAPREIQHEIVDDRQLTRWPIILYLKYHEASVLVFRAGSKLLINQTDDKQDLEYYPGNRCIECCLDVTEILVSKLVKINDYQNPGSDSQYDT